MLEDGVLAAQYLESWHGRRAEEAVLIAPAYSFLMMNRPATVQFWLDPGSDGWFQRLDQPLTHTRVLSRGWPPVGSGHLRTKRPPTSTACDASPSACCAVVAAGIVLCMSSVSEAGFEQRGRLLEAFQSVLQENVAS